MAEDRIRISDYVYLDFFSWQLIFLTYRGEKKVKIEPILAQLLRCLVQPAGAVVSQQELISRLGKEAPEEKILTKHIARLRKILRRHGCRHAIETIPQKGYRFKLAPRRSKWSLPQRAARMFALFILAFIALKLSFPVLAHFFVH